MNINTATALARRLLAKKTRTTQNPVEIILVEYGKKLPKTKYNMIIIEVLPEVNLARQILNESGVSNGLE